MFSSSLWNFYGWKCKGLQLANIILKKNNESQFNKILKAFRIIKVIFFIVPNKKELWILFEYYQEKS